MLQKNKFWNEVKETTFNIQSKTGLLRHILTEIMTSPDSKEQMVLFVKGNALYIVREKHERKTRITRGGIIFDIKYAIIIRHIKLCFITCQDFFLDRNQIKVRDETA